MHKIKTLLVLIVALAIATAPLKPVYATSLQDQLDQIQKDLAAIALQQQQLAGNINNQQSQLGVYQGEAGKIRAEVEKQQLEAATLQLNIDELNVNIKVLQEEISTKKQDIQEKETEVGTLEEQSSARILVNYMDYRMRGQTKTDLFQSKSVNGYFKDSQYQNIIQANSQKALVLLDQIKQQLLKDKSSLEESEQGVRQEKAVLDDKMAEMNNKQKTLMAKLDGYYSAIYTSQSQINSAQNALNVTSQQEAQKRAEMEKIQQQLLNSFNSIPDGQYVLAGTQIGNQGSTGWSTGPHLHFSTVVNGGYQNPCGYLPGGVIDGCGGNATLQWPLKGSFYYTSAYYSGYNGDLRCFLSNGSWSCSDHKAIDIAHPIWNAPVYAAHDGWLFKGVDQYGALYIVICQDRYNCNNGFKTGYWHLSSY